MTILCHRVTVRHNGAKAALLVNARIVVNQSTRLEIFEHGPLSHEKPYAILSLGGLDFYYDVQKNELAETAFR